MYEFIYFLQLSCMNSYIFCRSCECAPQARSASCELAAGAMRVKPELTSNTIESGCFQLGLFLGRSLPPIFFSFQYIYKKIHNFQVTRAVWQVNDAIEGSIPSIYILLFLYNINEFLAASAQHKPRGRSPSTSPAPTRPRPAASIVRVACGCPDSQGKHGCPNSQGCVRLPRQLGLCFARVGLVIGFKKNWRKGGEIVAGENGLKNGPIENGLIQWSLTSCPDQAAPDLCRSNPIQ